MRYTERDLTTETVIIYQMTGRFNMINFHAKTSKSNWKANCTQLVWQRDVSSESIEFMQCSLHVVSPERTETL